MLKLKPQTLWPQVVDCTKSALDIGALQPIETESVRVEQDSVNFILRVVSSLERKHASYQPASKRGIAKNPFLPFDDRLLVAELSDTHVCLLNKFNVIDHHLLFVTRRFEDQELPLTEADFEACLVGLREIDGLVFYNGGPIAGASEPHRHLQLVPLPLAAGEQGVPMEPLIREALSTSCAQSSPLPFRHAVCDLPREWLDDPTGAACAACHSYSHLLEASELIGGSTVRSATGLPPYNLLMTREWMLLIPRSHESWRDISINALGYAGSFFLRRREQVSDVESYGPMNVLSTAAFPSPS